MNFETILMEKNNSVARLTLNRPKELNAINLQLAAELFEALLACEEDPKIRVIILTGSGRAFCAGGDVPAFQKNMDNIETFLKRLTAGFHRCILQITRMRQPVIAAINGVAAGGGMGFALAPDLAIAAESAKFNMAYTGIAATPDGGTTFFLPRLVGVRKAMELSLLNRPLAAKEAFDWGLLNQVVADDQLAAEAEKLANKLAAGPTASYAKTKRLLYGSLQNSLESQLEEESRSISSMGATADFHEGVDAFLIKRKAEFQGR